MIGIRYNDTWLDVQPAAGLTWELNNLVFSGSDSTKLPGSFSFPFTLPATPHNRALLNFPDRIDNADPFLIDGEVQVCFNHNVLFQGTMKVTEASLLDVKVYIVANPLSALKTTPLNELDLGGDRDFADAEEVIDHAADTAADPLSYDYVFFPVWNREFLEEPSDDPRSRFQNFYDSTAGEFQVDDAYPALMPFVRLDYLLERIFAGAEYTFENRFQTTDELRLICLYNNKSLWTSEGLATTINLQNHVSKTGAAAFIRKLLGAFCLALFYNPWNKVLRLIPMNTIVAAPPKADWTDRLLYTPVVNSSDTQPEILCWKRDDNDGAWAHYDKYMKPASIDGEVTNAGLLAAAPGTYYVIDRHSYYLKNSIPRYFFKYTTLGCAPADTGKPAFEAELQPLWDIFLYSEGQTPVTDGNYVATPHCRIKGSVEYLYDPGGPDEEVKTQQNDIPDRITMYRGMYPDFDADNYPLALGMPWDTESNLIGEISLRWDSQYGMYSTWWQAWHTMLRNGKNVTAMLRLSIADIIGFNFEDKIRIQNQDFFVKRMRITLTPRGLAPVEVELVSTV